jgi:hypothetical protein
MTSIPYWMTEHRIVSVYTEELGDPGFCLGITEALPDFAHAQLQLFL